MGVNHSAPNLFQYSAEKAREREMAVRYTIKTLDFDRGAFREPGKWQQGNLDRLLRSLRKIQLLDSRIRFSEQDWQFLLQAYDAARGRA